MSEDQKVDAYEVFVDARAHIELLMSAMQILMTEHLGQYSMTERLAMIDHMERAISNRPLRTEELPVPEQQAQIDISVALGAATKDFAERMREFVRAIPDRPADD